MFFGRLPVKILTQVAPNRSAPFWAKIGFVAQIVLKTFLPLPQTDSAYGFCLGYAKSGEAI
jgi:hypothetical protein